MVRTMSNVNSKINPEERETLISSGAQIISTDYPMGYPGSKPGDLSWIDIYEFTN